MALLPRDSGKRYSARTLLETLTTALVLSIVVLLALPAAALLREDGKDALCLDRLRAVADATRAYTASDAGEWALPAHHLQFLQNGKSPSFIGAYEWGGKSGIGREGFAGEEQHSGPLSSRYGTLAGFGPASRPLNRYLHGRTLPDHLKPTFSPDGALADTQLDLDEVRCPSDVGPPPAAHCVDWLKHPGRSSYDQFGTSYAANILWAEQRMGASHVQTTQGCFRQEPYGGLVSNSPYLRPIVHVPNPARTISYEENIGRFTWACRRLPCDKYGPGLDPGPTKAIAGWHGRDWEFNYAFVDGHVDARRIIIDGTTDESGYAEHYRSETIFDDPQVQRCHSCDVIRGDGWQRDTLPSPQVVTGLHWNGKGHPALEDCVQP